MIQKLKRKFILINMSLVSVVLLIVFVTIGLFSYQQAKYESLQAIEKALERPSGALPPKMEINKRMPEKREPFLPVFSVLVDENNEIVFVAKENVDIDDNDVKEVTQSVLENKKNEGMFWSYQLRYMVRETPEGTKIAFVDMNREINRMIYLLTTMILVGFGALAAFFAVSVYLANWALKPVGIAWEQQKRFVADASHELKTPLTVILANTGILLSHKQDRIADQEKWLEYTQAEAIRMKTLIDDLLFLAKYDADHKPELQSEVNFSDVLWSSILPFESVAFEAGVTIDSQIEPDLKREGNEGQLKQLVMILMDNACKYAGKGGHITVRLSRQSDGILLRISNTGPAIEKDHLEHLFDRFYRVESARTREAGGYGLGLAIARTIAETHNGRISVESSEGEGTTFQVIF